MTYCVSDIIKFGGCFVGDILIYNKKEYVIIESSHHTGITNLYKPYVLYDILSNIKIMDLDTKEVFNFNYNSLTDLINNLTTYEFEKLETDVIYVNDIKRRVVYETSHHYILETSGRQEIIPKIKTSKTTNKIQEVKKYEIMYVPNVCMSTKSNPIFEIVDIYEEDDPSWSDFLLIIGKFKGYLNYKAYFNSGIGNKNYYQDIRNSVWKEVCEKLNGKKENEIQEFLIKNYEFVDKIQLNEYIGITRVNKSRFENIVYEIKGKMKYDDIFKLADELNKKVHLEKDSKFETVSETIYPKFINYGEFGETELRLKIKKDK